jgi:alkaline phosphatase
MNKLRKVFFLVFLSVTVLCYGQSKAKYIFLFIGDGMGVNQVNGTELYLGELQGKIGTVPLIFTQFPNGGFATTFSANSGITDSSAAGTALATGHKTNNGTVSLDPVTKAPMPSVASKAKAKGMKVGITTSVSMNDATPAVFYAHQKDRGMGYEIALDAIQSHFDFFAGGGFFNPEKKSDGTKADNIYPLFQKAGYTLAYGYADYLKNAKNKNKVVLMNNKDQNNNPEAIPYRIDRTKDDLSLLQITEGAINTLTRNNTKGFFLMVEAGAIDHACHANDAATAFNDVLDLNEAIKPAYEFYLKHPKETLIVVTADHETGGIVLGSSHSGLNFKVLQYQKVSQPVLSNYISTLRKEKNNKVSWDEIKDLLGKYMGLWKEVPVDKEQEQMIYQAYENSFVKGDNSREQSLYQSDDKLAATAKRVLNQIARVSWASGNHSCGYVPVFAVGQGSYLFSGKMDNTDIPKKICRAAGL